MVVVVPMETEDVGRMLAGSTVATPSTSNGCSGGQVLPTETGMAIQLGMLVCMGQGLAEKEINSCDSGSLHLMF